MADFVAVIRRAVDGLADNTPEMRARVYEKARGAVTRQLESMKPRPPEEMLRRQFDKLEAAITEVENEHAEALPPLEEEAVEQSFEAVSEAGLQAPPEPEPEPEAAPAAASEAEEPQSAVDYETSGYDAPASPYEDEPDEHPVEEHVAYAEVPHAEPTTEPAPEPQEPVWHEPALDPGRTREAESVIVDKPWLPHHDAAPGDEHVVVPEEIAPTWFKPVVADSVTTEVDTAVDAGYEETSAERDDHADAEQKAHDDSTPAWAGPDDHAFPEYPAEPGAGSVAASGVDEQNPAGAAKEAFNEAAAVSDFDDYVRDDLKPQAEVDAAEPKMPAAPDDLSWDPSPFDDVSLEPTPARKAEEAYEAGEDSGVVPLHGWQAGQGRRGIGEKAKGDVRPGVSPKDILDMDAVASARGPTKAIRTAPRRSINYTTMALGLLGLAVLGGGGYAAWSNKDTLTDMITDLVASPPATTPIDQTPPAKPGDTGGATTVPPATQTATASGTADDNSAAAPATPSGDGSVADKFTQRLLADGTEVNEGAGEQVASAATGEGKSIAEQNVAATEPVAAAEAGQAPATNPAAAATDVKALAVPGAQKMFLYEERLGQSVPTAIEGTVTWSIKREPGENGREEPTVQGQIVVPDRGLSALLTFRRNTDPSLPASHLVEIVFSLPPTFEGGSVESVQRIALKQTEQDRGNALIAVPAKITDDFHMIALNDFPDAMKTNLDLLKSRNWIDIPLTYRNGRRALLTMEKGTAGAEAFNTALRDWAAQGNAASNSQ